MVYSFISYNNFTYESIVHAANCTVFVPEIPQKFYKILIPVYNSDDDTGNGDIMTNTA